MSSASMIYLNLHLVIYTFEDRNLGPCKMLSNQGISYRILKIPNSSSASNSNNLTVMDRRQIKCSNDGDNILKPSMRINDDILI